MTVVVDGDRVEVVVLDSAQNLSINVQDSLLTATVQAGSPPGTVILDSAPVQVLVADETQSLTVVIESPPTTEVRTVNEQGPPGLSAYAVALRQGFMGTEADWFTQTQGDALAASQSALAADISAGLASDSADAAASEAAEALINRNQTAGLMSTTNLHRIAAQGSASTASNQASAAANSASAAAISEGNAESDSDLAEQARIAAESARDSAQNLLTTFSDQYLGSSATDPVVDGSGNSLTAGDVYFNTTVNNLRFYTGVSWEDPEQVSTDAAAAAAQSAIAASNDASAASTSASEALIDADDAQTSATAAENDRIAAEAAELSAGNSAIAAGNSESAAAQSATDAANAAATIVPENYRAMVDPVPWADLSGLPAFAIRWANWGEVSNKPSTFAPSAHGHLWSEITLKPAEATRWPTYAEVTDKPLDFTPSAHGHTWSELSAIPDFASRWPAFSEVTDKPSTFTPSAHNHILGTEVDLRTSTWILDDEGNQRLYFNGSASSFNGVIFKLSNIDQQFEFRAPNNDINFIISSSGRIDAGDVPWARLSDVPTTFQGVTATDLNAETPLAGGSFTFGRFLSSAANKPQSLNNNNVFWSIGMASGPTARQFAAVDSDTGIYTRRVTGGAWQPWVKFWTDADFSPADFASYGHNHAGENIVFGTIDDARLPTTQTGKMFTSDVGILTNDPQSALHVAGTNVAVRTGGSGASNWAHHGYTSGFAYMYGPPGVGARLYTGGDVRFEISPAGAATMSGPMRVTGRGTFDDGLVVPNSSVTDPTDLSKHIGVYGSTYGFSVTASTLNVVSNSAIDFINAESRRYRFDQNGLITTYSVNDRAINMTNGTAGADFGLYLNGRTAVTGEASGAWLRLNSGNEYTNGIYTPGSMRVDGNLTFGNSSQGLRNITGLHGSVEAYGNDSGGWDGFTIGGEVAFMYNNAGVAGIYNDLNNQWILRSTLTQATEIYYGVEARFQTGLRGVIVTDGTAGAADSSAGQLAVHRDVAGPYLSFHEAGAGREGFIQGGSARMRFSSDSGEMDWFTAGAQEMLLTIGGDLHVDGNIIAYSASVSDIRHKESLQVISDPLGKLAQVSGYHYRWKQNGKWDVGLIADEVEKILPHLVSEGITMSHGPSKTLHYDGFIALLVEAIKAQQVAINELKEAIYGSATHH